MPRSNEEHRIQCEIVKWCRAVELVRPELSTIHAIPNGGNRSAATGAMLKREGALAGVPDLHLPVPRLGYASLYIEVKTPQGRLSAAQNRVIGLLRKYGNRVDVVRTVYDGVESICNYLDEVDDA